MKARAAFLGLLLVFSSVFLSGPANSVRCSDQDSANPPKGEVVLTLRCVLTASSQAQGFFDEPAIKPEGEIRKELSAEDRISIVFSGTQRFNILDYDGNRVLLDNAPSSTGYSLTVEGGGQHSSRLTADGKVVQWAKGSWTYRAPPFPRDASYFYVEDIVLGGSFAVSHPSLPFSSPEVESRGEAFDISISPEVRPFIKGVGGAFNCAVETLNRALSDPGFKKRFKGTAPASKTGFQLTRQAEFAANGSEELGDHDHYETGIPNSWTGHVSVTYTLSYSPVPLDTDAVIETPKGYGQWWPIASKTENQAGRVPLTVMVRVHKRDAPKQPAPKKAKFRFELIDTTQERGVCMNWPKGGTDSYDLRIEKNKNPELRVMNRQGQQAETKEKDLDVSSVTISCFDYGAFGRLKVTAILDDGKGTEIPAYLDSDNSKYELTIPQDENDNKIADDWEKFNGIIESPEDNDKESDPEGDGNPGDGLTLYEEYRGFMEAGKHIYGEPLKKDLFLCNTIGPKIEPGIELFKSLTGFEVHSKLTKGELGDSRVVNRNHTSMPHAVDQHGLLIVRGPKGISGSEAVWTEESEKEGIIGTPKRYEHVRISFNLTKRMTASTELDVTVAHELLHCCSVWHHGDIDPGWKMIRAVQKPGGRSSLCLFAGDDDKAAGKGEEIDLYREVGETIVPVSADDPILADGRLVWVGEKCGQHSGDVFCVMRYDVAKCYINYDGKYVLFEDEEFTGSNLCSQTAGTGVNNKGRKPESRYGDANTFGNRGKCIKQLCVNDKYH